MARHDDIPDAHLRILAKIRDIPVGKVCTYGRIAALAGLPGRARLVGRILRDSPLASGVPWHRVVNSSGGISDRPGNGVTEQRALLKSEGVAFVSPFRVALGKHLWTGRKRAC